MRIILFLILTTFATSNATVFLLHGSFSTHDSWYKEGGAFYDALQMSARKYKEISADEKIESYSWRGGFMPREIIADGFEFAAHLLSHNVALNKDKKNSDITLVAHSNGGNVSFFGTMILSEMRKQRAKEHTATRHLHVPQSLYEPFIKPQAKKMHDIQTRIPPELEKDIATRYHQLYAMYSHDKNCSLLTQDFAIKALYLLGTPINTKRFDIATDTIAHVYNMTSEADLIQQIAGKKTIPDHERCWNIHITLHEAHPHCEECNYEENEEGELVARQDPVAPCHGCIHAPVTAQWLFEIPTLIQKQNASFNHGELLLHPVEKPLFTPR